RRISLRYFEPSGVRARILRSIALPYDVVRDAVLGLGLHDHVAFEEPSGDDEDEEDEDVFEVEVRVGGRTYRVEPEEAAIMLLIREIGGDVTIRTGSLLRRGATDVSITYVADREGETLGRLVALLDSLDARASRRRRPR